MSKYRYTPCALRDIPHAIGWDVPDRHRGQIVEVAYGGHSAGPHDAGAPYQRVLDRSDGSREYYRCENPAWD